MTQPSPGSPEDLLERIQRQGRHLHHLRGQIGILRGALHVVVEWEEPYPGFSMDQGSNGMRDHFRDIARNALAKP